MAPDHEEDQGDGATISKTGANVPCLKPFGSLQTIGHREELSTLLLCFMSVVYLYDTKSPLSQYKNCKKLCLLHINAVVHSVILAMHISTNITNLTTHLHVIW